MLNTILHNFKDAVTQAVVHSGFDSDDASIVHFVDPTSENQALASEAINIALFGSTAARNIRGESSFAIPNRDGASGIEQKPDLKVSLDVVLLFNFKKYALSLGCYGQVLGYFYNNDILKSTFNGLENEVEILLEGFDDRNEIELWNTFNAPGIPLLRYDLRYALVSGSVKQLPAIKEVRAQTSVPDVSNVSILILSLAYNPVQAILAKITSSTNDFCSVNLNADGSEGILVERQMELLAAYDSAFLQAVQLKVKLELELPNYFPAIEALPILINSNKSELEASGAPSPANFQELCILYKSKVEGTSGMETIYLESLDLSARTIEITTRIQDKIDAFVAIGNSTYKKSEEQFSNRSELSTLQLRKKWWELETTMNELKVQYSKESSNSILNQENSVNQEFKSLLNQCNDQLVVALSEFEELNKKYNSGELVEISSQVKKEYLNAYINCFRAINYINNGSVPENLSQGLLLILIEQNK
ncbi:MAG: hypothetical protein ACJASQ_000577 [Crocinitomicaceae bacterium]|jgi:hypothetical protein